MKCIILCLDLIIEVVVVKVVLYWVVLGKEGLWMLFDCVIGSKFVLKWLIKWVLIFLVVNVWWFVRVFRKLMFVGKLVIWFIESKVEIFKIFEKFSLFFKKF